MAQSRRVEKFSALIRKEMSELLMKELHDARLHSSMISISEVDVSGDLQHCKIFVSIFGRDCKPDEVLAGLEAAKGFLRGELARRLQMRRAPELTFRINKGVENATTVLNLLGKLEKERKNRDQLIQPLEE